MLSCGICNALHVFVPSTLLISYYGTKSRAIHCLNREFSLPVIYYPPPSLRQVNTEQSLNTRYEVHSTGLVESLYMIARWCCLGCVYAPFLATSPLLTFLQTDVKKYWWDSFRFAICMTGPCEIKLAQWAATRRDLFSKDTCDELGQLQTNARGHPWEDSEAALCVGIGCDWRDKLQVIQVVGCGSVAQVYRARLIKDINKQFKAGDLVAVKVIHSNVADDINSDLAALNWLAEVIEYFWPRMKFASVVDSTKEFSDLIRIQTDLDQEAQSLEKFNLNFNSEKYHVRFPKVCKQLSSKHVLVESFEEGYPINEAITCCDDQTKRQLASLGLNAFFKMLFQDNFVHADLHPGNILVHDPRLKHDMVIHVDDGRLHSSVTNVDRVSSWLRQLLMTIKKGGRHSEDVELVLLDTGLTTSLSSSDLKDFIDLFHAIIQGQGDLVADLIMSRGGNSQLQIEADKGLISAEELAQYQSKFRQEIHAIVREATNGMFLRRIQVSKLLEMVLNACCTNHIRLSPKFSSVVLSTAVLEGLGKSLDPEVDVMKIATPYIIDAHFMNF